MEKNFTTMFLHDNLNRGCDKFPMIKGGAYLRGGVLKSVQSSNYGAYDNNLSDLLDF